MLTLWWANAPWAPDRRGIPREKWFSSAQPNRFGAASVVMGMKAMGMKAKGMKAKGMKATGMNRYPIAAAVAGLFVLLAACGSSEPSASSPGGIVISGFAYSGSLTVKAGQEVTVTNEDPTQHTLTDQRTGLFSTGTIEPSGGTRSFTAPTEPGSYPFVCRVHPTMLGTLTVQG